MKVTDRFAAPLAARLGSIDAEDLIEDAFDVAVDDTREYLRHELQAEGASQDLVNAVELISEDRYMHATVGVPGDHPAAEEASDHEYGDFDHEVAPHGTFRMAQDEMRDIATSELAARIEEAVHG